VVIGSDHNSIPVSEGLSRNPLYHEQDGKSPDPIVARRMLTPREPDDASFHAFRRIGHAEPKPADDIVRMSKNIVTSLVSKVSVKRGELMSAADQYRRNASECIAITAFFVDPQQRAAILALAEAWARLAEHAEKNEQIAMLIAPDPSPQSGEQTTD
jgi:hypothetical protein